MIDKVSLDKFITGEGNDEYENQYTMDGYEQQYKESQDAIRKYAHDLRNAENKLNLALDVIISLTKEIGTSIPPRIQKQIKVLTKGGYRG